MKDANSKGLGREIPSAIKREVRQRDGFGCVVCGSAIIQYEHFDPEFSEALEHTAAGITLLCGRCHDKKTRGLLSLETVKRAVRNPKCKQSGFSFEAFDIDQQPPSISLGTLKFRDVAILIKVLGESIFSIKPPESIGSPFLISAKITDSNGKAIFEIDDNEWKTFSDNWDVEISGRRITIRKGMGDIALIIRSEPPGSLVVEKIKMFHRGTLIAGQEGRDITVRSFNGTQMVAQGATFIGCQVGIEVGIFDLKLGVGGGVTIIESMTIGSEPRRTAPLSNLPVRVVQRRNSPCWCGSGVKFKKCHGKPSNL